MKYLVGLFSIRYPKVLVYMLQNVEYQPRPYLQWYWRVKDFNKVIYRKQLDHTAAARLLQLGIYVGVSAQLAVGLMIGYMGMVNAIQWQVFLGVVLAISYPVAWAHLIVLPLYVARIIIVEPKNQKLIKASTEIFRSHPGITIAVAGSYGKTSMKELLVSVLSTAKNVAATPANRNVSVSHAAFARSLEGNEDILVLEYGEGAPGDVARFAEITKPDIGIITGLAPAHLDQYPSLEAAGKDIFSLAEAVDNKSVFVNSDSLATHDFIKPGFNKYNSKSVLGWDISNVEIGFGGTKFQMKKGNQKIVLHSGLLGRHQIGPLALVAALADKLGLSRKEIEEGVALTHAFSHRMQPRSIHGAWIIDDTYNGNIDGMEAGLALLKELPGKRKLFVTPGLVDQGEETEHVHKKLGQLIAEAAPDQVVLIKNSVTSLIQAGLVEGNFAGEVLVEDQPLEFYTNIEHIVAAGDVVLMQNDWTDNYN